MKDAALRLAALAAFASVFLACAAGFTSLAGVGHDEALHGVLAARWLSPDLSPADSGWMPWMTSSYVGTPKAFPVWAAYKLHGIGVPALRATTLAFGAAAVAAAAALAFLLEGGAAALLVGAVAATDLSIVLGASFDTGPQALSLFLKLAGFAFAAAWWRRRLGPAALAAAGACFGVAVWDKAHMLWLLAALAPAAALTMGPELRKRLDLGELFALGAGFGFGAAPWVVYNLLHPFATFLHPGHLGWSLGAHVRDLGTWTLERAALLRDALSGAYFARWVGDLSSGDGVLLLPLALTLLGGTAAAAAVFRRAGAAPLRRAAFWTLLALGTFAAAALSPLPVKGHHLYLLVPLPLLAFAAALEAACASVPALARRRKAVWSSAAAVLLCANGLALRAARDGFAPGGSSAFFTGVDALAREAEAASKGAPVFAQARLAPQLLLASQGRLDPRPVRADGKADPELEDLLDTPGALLALREPDFLYPDEDTRLLAAAAARLEPVASVPFRDGRTWARLLRVKDGPASGPKRRELVARALRHYERGELALARKDLEAARRLRPKDAAVLLSLGVVLLQQKDRSALEVLDQAVAAASAAGDPQLSAAALSTRTEARKALYTLAE